MSLAQKKLSQTNDKQLALPRAKIEWRVGMKTFGTRHYLNMVTSNVSASGILVKIDDPKADPPFQRKTLLELVFYPDGKYLTQELRGIGVVVRSVEVGGADPRKEQFGVRIVEAPEGFEALVSRVLNEAQAS